MKNFLLIALVLTTNVSAAQIVDNFSDDDHTNDPTWSGNTTHFTVNTAHQLQLNNTVAATSNLYTPFTSPSIDGFEWEVYARHAFASSGSNYSRIYIVSNSNTLTSPLNGYYIQLGEAGSSDAVELFRQSGSTHVSVCRAAAATIASAFAVRIKVTRSVLGEWKLFVDYDGGANLVEVASGTDVAFTSSTYFGVVCVYTAGNANKFYFDDVYGGPPRGDVTPPSLQTTVVTGPTELTLTFSEPLDSASPEDTSHFNTDFGLGHPLTADLQPDQKTVKLTYSDPFLNGKLYQLQVNGVQDVAGNEMNPETVTFRHFVPEAPSLSDLVINELFPDPSPSVGLPAYEFIEIYNKSTKAFDLAGWKLSDLTSSATLPSTFLLPGENLIITSSAGFPHYELHGSTIALADFPTLNNSSDAFRLADPGGQLIDTVAYLSSWYQDDDKALGGYSLERLNPTINAMEPSNWLASAAALGGTPGGQNSVFGLNPDQQPPQFKALKVVSDSTLAVIFNEPLDPGSACLTSHYHVSPEIKHPIQVSLGEEGRVISLVFKKPFGNGLNYALTMEGIKDVAGNQLDALAKDFVYLLQGEISKGCIVINEIMADPTPVVHLPEAEYVELLNRSTVPFNLSGWTLRDATAAMQIPPMILLPGEHLIITSASNHDKLSPFGKIVFESTFPSLSNSGETLKLISPNGQTIDSLIYQLQWYHDDEKSEGGYSLERLDPFVASTEATNWLASIAEDGGTPGAPNSVFGKNPDAIPPKLDSLRLKGDRQLLLFFDEPLDSARADSIQNYRLEPGGKIPANVRLSGDCRQVTLLFEGPFPNGVKQVISYFVADVASNSTGWMNSPFRFLIEVDVHSRCVVINEIMSDPSPVVHLPEAEYIELFNNSNYPYDLKDWTLSDATTKVKLPSVVILPHDFVVLTSTTNLTRLSAAGHIAAVTPFPSLNNTGEPLVIRSRGGVVVDSLTFSSAWHNSEEKKDGGWSLERLRYNYNSSMAINWTTSADSSGGTPGRVNSLAGRNPDSVPPSVVSAVATNATTLVIGFSESLYDTVPCLGCFSIDETLPATVAMPDPTTIHLTLAAPFVNGSKFLLRMAGIMDTARNEMYSTTLELIYFKSTPVENKSIVINEIMFDPSPPMLLPEAEYVELFNRSENPIDLGGWRLSDDNSFCRLPPVIIHPGAFLTLTSTGNAGQFSTASVIGVIGFPSLSNDGEAITLYTADDRLIDSVFYSPAWLRNEEKQEGGWSVELIDPTNLCSDERNWSASVVNSGGTPGAANSIFANKPDVDGPTLLQVVAGFNSLELQFDEQLDPQLASANITLTPVIAPVSWSFSDHTLRSVSMVFSDSLRHRVSYTIGVEGFRDCSHNAMSATFRKFALPETAAHGDLVINEVLFNPRPNCVDFVEIYNRSDKYIDLAALKVVNAMEEKDGSPAITQQSNLISPGTYKVITPAPTILGNNYPNSMSDTFIGLALPSMPDDQGTIFLVDAAGLVLDSLAYDESFHSRLLRDPEGVSLERISADVASTEVSNWISASESVGFATPGFLNSAARPDGSLVDETMSISPEIISQHDSNSFAMISYTFRESGNVVSLKVVDRQGRIVKEIANNVTVGSSGFFRWDGDRDDGSTARPGYYVVWLQCFNLEGSVVTARKRLVIAPH